MLHGFYSCILLPVYCKQRTILIFFIGTQNIVFWKKMATRTSTRSTKAVKFVDSAGSDDEDDLGKSSTLPVKTEGKKPRGRPPKSHRNQPDDDDEWDARGEHIEEEEDDHDDPDDDLNESGRDVTKKSIANRTMDSVYDFG